MKKLQVGVLMGGRSIEKEVSFNSGRTVCDHLDTSSYDILPLFQTDGNELYILPWRFLHRGKISDFEHRLKKEAQKISWEGLKNLVDFVFLALHGRYGEDGTIQGLLEILQIPYLGSKVLGSALSRDKAFQKSILRAQGIEVPRDISLTPYEVKTLSLKEIIARLEKAQIKLPCVVKPHIEGSSLGITVVFEREKLLDAIQTAAWAYPEKMQTVLIEEKLEGMEFCGIAITDYKTNTFIPLPITEVVIEPGTHFFDYEQKYMPGRAGKYTPARCTKEISERIQQTCLQVAKALGLTNIVRIDGFLTRDNRVVILDLNTITGMGPASFLFRQAAEINMGHTQLINHIIETELQAYGISIHKHKKTDENSMPSIEKKRIAVLLGGRSNEKEISLESGRNIVYKLSPQKYEAIPVFVDKNLNLHRINQQLLVCHSTQEIEIGLTPEMRIAWDELPQLADFVFIALHGGEGENGCVQGALEMLGIPYNGSGVLTSALCMDKYRTNQYLKTHGFTVPKSILVQKRLWVEQKNNLREQIECELGYPVIIKPHDDGCSVLVQKAADRVELEAAIEKLFASEKTVALIEECITGMELTVGVIGNEVPQALPPSQAVATKGILSIEEKFLPGAGENQTPAPLPAAALQLVQDTIARAYATLQCKGYARIDCFYQTAEQSSTGTEQVVILEVNTLPGMTPATCIFHQAAEIGIKPMDFVDMIIELGFQEHATVTRTSAIIPEKKSQVQKDA